LRKSSGQKNNVRVDIAFDEMLVSGPLSREIFQQFDDDIETEIPTYALEEIVAEKLRSILQRGKSRDYYDVWILLKDYGKDFDQNRTRDIFSAKCRFKGIPYPKTEDFFKTEQLAEAERFWERGLAHQLTGLPGFNAVIAELRPLIEKLIQ
jgi:predicted nucleotidyltransferase component of viral defense system